MVDHGSVVLLLDEQEERDGERGGGHDGVGDKVGVVCHGRHVEGEEEDHPHRVVDAGEEAPHDALRDGVHQFDRKLEEDGATSVGQGAGEDGRNVQLDCKKSLKYKLLSTNYFLA